MLEIVTKVTINMEEKQFQVYLSISGCTDIPLLAEIIAIKTEKPFCQSRSTKL